MKILALAFSFLSVMLYTSAFAGEPLALTPQAITKDIENRGAKATVQKLISGKRPRLWESVLQKIKTGGAPWLAVAKELADGTDAGTSEALQIALATALPKNPSGVLQLAGTQGFLSLEDICGAPFIEPEPTDLKRYLDKTRRSLNNLKDMKVEQKRVKCLNEIERVISEESSKNLNQQTR